MEPPANTILGTGIYAPRMGNFPFDAAKTLTGTGSNILRVSDKTVPWTIPGSQTTYNVPTNVKWVPVQTSTSNYHTYRSSSDAKSDIEAKADLKANYMAFSGSASTSIALKEAFNNDSYFALFAFVFNRYSMALIDNMSFPDQFGTVFAAELAALPQPFNADIVENRSHYEEFLYRWGTHIVTSVTFGQRYFFKVAVASSKMQSFQKFEACVAAKYGGLGGGIEGSAGATSEQDLKTFRSQSQTETSIDGGDSMYHAQLSAHPEDKDIFAKWSGDVNAITQDKPLHLNLTSMDDVLRVTSGSKYEKHADDIQMAISYLLRVRETFTPGACPAYTRICMFVKVKDNAITKGNVTLLLSDDAQAKMSPAKDKRQVWNANVSKEGFEYGRYGRSLRFENGPYKASATGYGFEAGYLTRFDMAYGPTTTLNFIADANIEYVVFASGQGRLLQKDGPNNQILSNHVYWVPGVDANPLVLKDVDLGIGAQFRSSDVSGPSKQFDLWEKVYGLHSFP